MCNSSYSLFAIVHPISFPQRGRGGVWGHKFFELVDLTSVRSCGLINCLFNISLVEETDTRVVRTNKTAGSEEEEKKIEAVRSKGENLRHDHMLITINMFSIKRK